MNKDTQGWFPIYDIKDQCGQCKNIVTEHRMAACEYGVITFPAAHNCARFTYEDADDDTPR